MKYLVIALIFFTSCTQTQQEKKAVPEKTSSTAGASTAKKALDRENEKIKKWFEQMDAIMREAVWVVRKDRPPVGKSIFGKMQRALLIETNQRLSNKSLFRCDSYTMSRQVASEQGVPQTAEVLHRCGSKESYIKIGSWEHPSPNTLKMRFQGGNLEEVLGVATGILSPQITCELSSNETGTIEKFSCSGLMIDYDSKKNQVLKFSRFEYERGAKMVLHLRAEILESLDPIRKIEADVPIEGSILVTETVLQAPMVEAKQVPAVSPSLPQSPTPISPPTEKEDPNGFAPQGPIIQEEPVAPQDPPQGAVIQEVPAPRVPPESSSGEPRQRQD